MRALPACLLVLPGSGPAESRPRWHARQVRRILQVAIYLTAGRPYGSMLMVLAAVCLSASAIVAKWAYVGGVDPLMILTVRLDIAMVGIRALCP